MDTRGCGAGRLSAGGYQIPAHGGAPSLCRAIAAARLCIGPQLANGKKEYYRGRWHGRGARTSSSKIHHGNSRGVWQGRAGDLGRWRLVGHRP